jgi:hypothetical protein
LRRTWALPNGAASQPSSRSCNGDGLKLCGLDLDVLAFADFVTLDDF